MEARKRTLVAAGLGWMLDAFDVMLYSLVLTTLTRTFGMSKTTAGLLNTVTLLASSVGAVIFGFLADRYGRRRLLSVSILTYSMSTFACGLCNSVGALGFCRFVLGLGMGGEWNTGAALVGESWPTHQRGRAMALVQSSWAIGYALAAITAGLLITRFGWRSVFFVGILPALTVFWIRRNVPESKLWEEQKSSGQVLNTSGVWRTAWPSLIALFAVNACGMFAWWGLFSWIPAYLALPVQQGGRGFPMGNVYVFLTLLNLIGMFPGYLVFGVIADAWGRRKIMFVYLLLASGMTFWFAAARTPSMIFVAACATAFFGTGFFTGSALIGNELFPTAIRSTALGISYNAARSVSAFGPTIIGAASEAHGLSYSFYCCAGAFLLAAMSALFLTETRDRELT